MKLQFVMSLLTWLMIATALQAQPDLPKGEDLFAAARKVSGFEAKGAAVKTITAKGKLRIPPSEAAFDFEMVQTVTGKGAMKLIANGQTMETVFDGTRAWSQVGSSVPTRAESMDGYLMMQLLIANGIDRSSYFDSIETIGKSDFEKIPCYEVECRKGEKVEMYCYFSVESGLEVGRTSEVPSPSGPLEIQLTYDDYREVEGLKIPHKRIVRFPQRQELESLSVEISDSIDESLFQRGK